MKVLYKAAFETEGNSKALLASSCPLASGEETGLGGTTYGRQCSKGQRGRGEWGWITEGGGSLTPQSPPSLGCCRESWSAHLQGGHSLRGVSPAPFPKGGHLAHFPGHVQVVVLLARAGCGAGGTLGDGNCRPGPCD